MTKLRVLFETTQVYTVTDDNGNQFSVTVTHHAFNDSYDYKVESLDDTIITGRKHEEILDFVLND
ncbi:hypothetical protein LCGC14_2285530 [marine sediment metagenome]|uniref:Uncharacterized protein n=1 Tax=marine sediment metagenome TaxID=412755 RepID=A0A0F9CT97_9ZZZZ